YSQALSNQQGFNPTINLAWAQNADLTNDGITCFGSNTAGIYRLLVNGNREDEFNEDKIIQAYGNALLTHYTNRQYGQGYSDYKLPIASITYTMSPEQAFVDGFCMRFSAAVRGTPIVELPVIAKGLIFDVSQSTHRGTTSALAISQALYRIPMKKIWTALEAPTIVLNHSGYTILDLLNELDAQGYDTKAIRAEFFASTTPTPDQILQRVAENFAKIEDMRAKRIDWGTITITTGTETIVETFGPTERIFMQKKPDKVKITSITGTPTTFILNGDTLYLSSEEIGVYSQIISDTLDIDISGLNLYSSPDKFMKGFNNILKDEIDNIYVIEITPKIEEEHGKILIYVDYNKGVIMKTEIYDPDDVLMVRTEVREIVVEDDIYIPTKYLETKFLDEIIITTEAVFSDIKLNSGILDNEFEL
ncbi:MAG: hypothetical protein AB1414_16660, partial [bacterium]